MGYETSITNAVMGPQLSSTYGSCSFYRMGLDITPMGHNAVIPGPNC